MNRAHRRLARMTGRAEPSSLELRSKLQKRVGRLGLPYAHGSSSVASGADSLRVTGGNTFRKGNGQNGNGNGNANGNTSTSSPAANSTTSTTSTDSTTGGPGLAAGNIQAAAVGGLTAPQPPTASDSIGLSDEANDVGYIAAVQIGTPPRDFQILMDSGSADFWVGAEGCQEVAENTKRAMGGAGLQARRNGKNRNGNGNANGGANGSAATAVAATGNGAAAATNCGNHVFLGATSSSSFVDSGKPFQVTYGTGAVAGDIITDDVTIANLTLQAHTFGVALQETDDFASDSVPFDGLMGLAQSTLSNQGVSTPVESLAQQGLISSAITSFKLGRLADGTNTGEITFGALDPAKFNAASLTTFDNVNTEGFWEGAMDAVTVDGTDLGLSGRTAILDTGTTLIVAPTADAEAVHAAINGAKSDGQGGFTIPCGSTAQVALSFGGQSFNIDTRDLLFSLAATNPAAQSASASASASASGNVTTGDCVSGISSGQIGGANEWLVGDVFLKNVYFSTDVGKNAISLATLTGA